jgi:hypothetical protein
VKNIRLASSLLAGLLLAGLTFSCGMGRKLETISISQTMNGEQITFVASGTFTSAPTTVTPLAVQWTVGLMAPPPPTYSYTLTSQPYVFNCTGVSGPQLPVGAYAPIDPNAPASGSTKFPVIAYASVNCPQR